MTYKSAIPPVSGLAIQRPGKPVEIVYPPGAPRKVFALHTSTHPIEKSSSAAVTKAALDRMVKATPGAEVKWIDASKLHIVQNLSCYANGKPDCANPAAGPYRCWAHHESTRNPEKYGGKDQMPVIYDALAWCDTAIFTTSVRWGSRSALCQKVIERMDTLENRGASYGEPYPLRGKKLGVVVTGLHWKTGEVATGLMEALRWFGFATTPDDACVLAWQRSNDPMFEHPDNDRPHVETWLRSPEGTAAVDKFSRSVSSASKVWV